MLKSTLKYHILYPIDVIRAVFENIIHSSFYERKRPSKKIWVLKIVKITNITFR